MKRGLFCGSFILLTSCIFSGCSAPAVPVTSNFFAMNSLMTITTHGTDSDQACSALKEEVLRLDQLWSATNVASDLHKLNQNAGSGTPISISPETAQLLTHANRISIATNQSFNPILAPVSSLWDFTTEQVPNPTDLNHALPLTTHLPTITLSSSTASLEHPNQALDLGAMAKGACSNYLAQILQSYDVDGALVSLGTSSVFSFGMSPDKDPWQLGIKDPKNTSETLGLFSLLDGQTCSTSGAYQQSFLLDDTLYHHILDPDTGYPSAKDLTSVTVISYDGGLTDALSTALFVMGSTEAISFWRDGHFDFNCILVTDSTIYITEDLSADFILLERDTAYELQILRR